MRQREIKVRAAAVGSLLFVLRVFTFAQTVPSVDELVNKNIAALGGSEKIRAMQTIKMTGRIDAPGELEFPFTIYAMHPDFRRFEMQVFGKSVISAFDGNDAWTIDPSKGTEEPIRGSETELRRERESSDGSLTSDLFDYREKGSMLELAGNEEVRGRAAYKLKLVNKHGVVKYIYLDAETFLESKKATVATQDHPEIEADEYPSDYRPVAGVMMPYFVEMRKDGTEPVKVVVEKIEVNLALDDSLFRFPVAATGRAPREAPALPAGALRVRVTQHGYEPAKLELPANQSVTLAFTRESASGCGGEVVFPSLKIRKALPLGEAVLVDLPPQPIGEIRFSCGMGMLRGMIVAR